MAKVSFAEIETARSALLAADAFFELEQVTTPRGTFNAYKHAPKNLIELLSAGRAHGDATLIVYEDERWTFNEFYQKVDSLRCWLVNEKQVKSGDRIAIAMRNYPEWLVAFTASVLSGAITVPLNSWGKADELQHGIADCEPVVLFCDQERYDFVASNANNMTTDLIVARSENIEQSAAIKLDSLLLETEGFPAIAEVETDSTALVLYTSGSTGYPKGVILTHRTMGQCLMNMYYVGALCSQFADPAMDKFASNAPCNLITVPLFHGTGLWGGFFVPLQMGGKVVLMYKWDAKKALSLIDQEQVTLIGTVPAIVRSLLKDSDFDRYNTETLCRVSMAGSLTPHDLPALIHEKLGYVSRSTGWAMTETCSIGSSMGDRIYDDRPDSAGLISPIVELRMVDEQGNVVADGDEGEIECSGVTMTPGYWRRPDATAEIYHDGWLRTGDVGRLDEEGFLYITGRVKDIVIRGGENIFPGEIEDVAYSHEAIEEVCVFGVPDEELGEVLAMVYFSPHKHVTQTELETFISDHLGAFKVPKYISVSEQSLPLNISGKIDKRKIRELFLSQTLN